MNLPTEDNYLGELPEFALGDLVEHVRYGYRGVVVDFDMTCHASELWFNTNQTQPNRDQPWYHVLVDVSAITTYAAQTSLCHDPSPGVRQHRMLGRYFLGFDEVSKRYLRNDEPWIGWSTP